MSVYLDTHIAIWLHAGGVEHLSSAAKRHIEQNELLISPMVFFEFQYLYDRKRVAMEPDTIYTYLNATFGVSLCSLPFAAVAREAITVTWTSDPFDRIIIAQASANRRERLITADTKIRKHYDRAVW